MKQSKKDRKIQKLQSKVAELKVELDKFKDEPTVYGGKGILFTVFEHSKSSMPGPISSIQVIQEAIEEAHGKGITDSEGLSRFLTSSSFHHITGRRARFNSLVRAGDVVGAKLSQKLFNAYRDKCSVAGNLDEARGFAEAITIMFSPFAVEDSDDPREVDWELVHHYTDLMEDQMGESEDE